MLRIDQHWSIELAGDDAVAGFAAGELRRTLQRIGAPPLPIVAQASGPRIALHYGAQGDGFVREADAQGLRLVGAGPRGLLYAVYDLLEALGCHWVAPGHEQLPRYRSVAVPGERVAAWPALQGRCLIIGHDFFLHEAEHWIVWAARNRLNTIFVHTIAEPLALGACHLDAWHARRAKLLPLLRERGMLLELGGHGLRALLPRHLFRRDPAMFRFNGTARSPDHNFCPSSVPAQAIVRRNAAAFFRAYPEADCYHLWADDILGGGWCRCPQCVALSASDQALLATNVLAEALAHERPGARIAYLAYHDTQAAPTQVQPLPNVVLTFAPRSRSYGQALGDPASQLNAGYLRDLQQNVAWFAAAGCGEQRAFEYYLDGLLFKSALPPLTPVLAGDIAAYRAAGVGSVQALLTGDRPWLAAPLNAYLFARLAWQPEQSAEQVVAQYAVVRAPQNPQALATAYKELAAAWQPALALEPAEVAQRLGLNIGEQPPADVLDYMAAPQQLRERRLERIEREGARLERVWAAWTELLSAPGPAAVALAGEQAEAELSMLLLTFITLRQRLYVLEGRAAATAPLQEAMRRAQGAQDALLTWGARYLQSPRALAGYTLLRQLGQLQLDAVRARWGGLTVRSWLQLRAGARIAPLLARLRFAR